MITIFSTQYWLLQVKKMIINNIFSILKHYPQYFKGLGKLWNYQVKLYTDNSVKTVAVSPRCVAYHLSDRVPDAIDNKIKEGAIEEHPINDPPHEFPMQLLFLKPMVLFGSTLDGSNTNEAIISTYQPKQEDIRAQFAGA